MKYGIKPEALKIDCDYSTSGTASKMFFVLFMISRGYDWENEKRRGSVVGGLRAIDIIEHKDRKNWLKSRI